MLFPPELNEQQRQDTVEAMAQAIVECARENSRQSETKEQVKHTPTVEKTRFGWFVNFGGFQSAMPDEKTARESAAAPELLEACKAALTKYRLVRSQIFGTDAHEEMLRAAIRKAEGR